MLNPNTRRAVLDGYENVRKVIEAAKKSGVNYSVDGWTRLYEQILVVPQ